MDTSTISNLFCNAVAWNAFLYTVQKALTILFSITAYAYLSSDDFITWSLINSYVYLALLWTDFGFRKSLPRYIPLYNSYSTLKQFIIRVCSIKLIILILSCIFGVIYITQSNPLYITPYSNFLMGLFITEGLIDLIRIIFHSLFLHKIFNSTLCLLSIGEKSLSLMLLVFYPSINGFITLTTIKIFANILTIMITLGYLRITPIKNKHSNRTNAIPQSSFTYHSFIMWTTSLSKSLSERNVITTLLTFTAGPILASQYKVANDIALFFQRIIIKSIGVTDTVILSQHPNTFKMIRSHILSFVTTTSVLSLGTIAFLWNYQYDMMIINLFSILVGGYLIEVALSPYERMLEVQQEYRWLVGSYIPYYITLIYIGLYPSAGILCILGALFVSKIIGLAIMRLRAKLLLQREI